MERICIIPCGKSKIWDKYPNHEGVEARNVYTGAFHKACLRYASTFFGNWVILSAKHGFLLPDDIVPCNYDVSFNSKSPEIITNDQLKKQVNQKKLDEFEEIVVLGGKKYIVIVNSVFGDGYKKRFPLSDCKGIGYMLQKLNNAIANHQEI
jgi:hypothetical protein